MDTVEQVETSAKHARDIKKMKGNTNEGFDETVMSSVWWSFVKQLRTEVDSASWSTCTHTPAQVIGNTSVAIGVGSASVFMLVGSDSVAFSVGNASVFMLLAALLLP